MRPIKILDLCCGSGIAAIGYEMAFSDCKIVGWDIEDMSSQYPFEFNQGDAFALDYEYLAQFDLIHMSPPCQRYSKRTPKHTRQNHPHLIPNALLLGYSSGKPFVVENVPGSTAFLKPTACLITGGKTRFFHASFPVMNREWKDVKNIMSSSYSSKKDVFVSWGIPEKYWHLGMRDVRQGIPPLMTRHIGLSFMISQKS